MIHISRNGEVIGEFSQEQVAAMLSEGSLEPSDFYWREGMQGWEALETLIPPVIQAQESTPTKSIKKANAPLKRHLNYLEKRNVSTEGLSKEQVQALYDDIKAKDDATKAEEKRIAGLISPKQKAFLDYHGIKYSSETKKEDASIMIEQVVQQFPDSQWNTFKHLIRPDLYEKPAITVSKKEAVAQAQEELEEAKERLKSAKADSSLTEDEIAEIKDEVEWAKDALKEIKEDTDFDYNDQSILDDWSEMIWQRDEDISDIANIVKKPSKSQLQQVREKLGNELGLELESLNIYQFCSVYLQMFPDSMKKGQRNPFGNLVIPKVHPKGGKALRSGGVGFSWFRVLLIAAFILFLIWFFL